jgi:hypothetical protein
MKLYELPKFIRWITERTDLDSTDVESYLSYEIHPEDVLISKLLLFPEFFEYRNCIIHPNCRCVLESLQGSNINIRSISKRQEFEKSWNNIKLWDELPDCKDSPPDEVWLEFAKLVQYSWLIHLNHMFPDRKFVVELSFTEQDYGPVLTVYEQ